MAAVNKGCDKVCELLLENGAKIDVNNSGRPIFVGVGTYGHIEVANVLLTYGADINAQEKIDDRVGNTALIEAALWGNYELCEFLIKQGADINALGYQSNTAFTTAARNNHPKVCELLLKYGADMHFNGDCSIETFSLAAERDKSKMCKLFLDNGILVNINSDKEDADSVLKSALRCAASHSKDKACRIILSYTIILPTTEDAIARDFKKSKSLLHSALCLFTRHKVPKDIRWLILNRVKEVRDELFPVLLHLALKGKKLPQALQNMVAAKIATHTMAKLKSAMVKAIDDSRFYVGKLESVELLLNQETLEERFGDKILNNINHVIRQKRLHIYRPKEVVEEQKSFCLIQ